MHLLSNNLRLSFFVSFEQHEGHRPCVSKMRTGIWYGPHRGRLYTQEALNNMLHVEAPILLAYSFRILVEAHALTRPYSVVVGMLDVQTLLLFD